MSVLNNGADASTIVGAILVLGAGGHRAYKKLLTRFDRLEDNAVKGRRRADVALALGIRAHQRLDKTAPDQGNGKSWLQMLLAEIDKEQSTT